jgi:hypothetical protein
MFVIGAVVVFYAIVGLVLLACLPRLRLEPPAPPPPMPVLRLPAAVLAKASRLGYEHAWRLRDAPEAIAAARACGLATVGGVVQFRIPVGTCELYWREADAEPRRTGEPWSEYAARSAEEVSAAVHRLPVPEMIAEGVNGFSEIAALRDAGTDVAEYLYIVLYFDAPDAEPDGAADKARNGGFG